MCKLNRTTHDQLFVPPHTHKSVDWLQSNTLKQCLDDQETTSLDGPQSPVRRSHISMYRVIELATKDMCLERPHFYGQREQSFKTGSTVQVCLLTAVSSPIMVLLLSSFPRSAARACRDSAASWLTLSNDLCSWKIEQQD